MQHFCKTSAFILLALTLLAGCREDVDLNNLDTRAELEMGIALPIGEVSASLGDFLGVNTVHGLYTDENGAFFFRDTFDITPKQFHHIDLTKYVMKNDIRLEMTVKDKLGGLPFVMGNGHTQIALEFPFSLHLSGINEDVNSERLDSMLITSARFHTGLDVTDLGLDWSEIDKVALVLGDRFDRPAGDTVWIPISGYNYGQEIPINVDNFSLCLMQDRSNPYGGCITDIDLKILFYFTVRNEHTIPLSDNSAFACNIALELLNYKSVWGFFEAGNQMHDANTLSLDDVLGSAWQTLKNLRLRFAEPEITLFISHKIAAPLLCHLGKLQTTNAQTGETASASWNGETAHDFPLNNTLDPIHSALTDSVENSALFSHLEREGDIDNLFEIKPDSLAYDFDVRVDKNKIGDYPQFRITDDVMVRAKADLKLPFVFKEQSSISIDTVFTDVNLSAASLDSLLENIDVIDSVKTAELNLHVVVKNTLPFAMKAHLDFQDKDGNSIPMDLGFGDTLIINGPKKEHINNKMVMEPAETSLRIHLSKNEWKRFAQVQQVRLYAELGDNQAASQLDIHQKLSLRMGLSAKADAIFDFNSIFKKGGEEE